MDTTRMDKAYHGGSVEAFKDSWSAIPENERYHFKRGQPENKIQFAFQNHWRVFSQIMGDIKEGRVLEVGCGRGSMGAFFADNRFEVQLVDTSPTALKIADANFRVDKLKGYPVCGGTLALPYADGLFDVVVSIGLLEHFADIEEILEEQVRVLRKGGVFLGYVVPEWLFSVQMTAFPLNLLLRTEFTLRNLLTGRSEQRRAARKQKLYRNAFVAADYLAVLRRIGVEEQGSFGMFPVPQVSHSPKFPFSLMAPGRERLLVSTWRKYLKSRFWHRGDPWTCAERWGLAFLVWAKK